MYSYTVTFSAFEITKLSFAMLEEMDKFFLAKTNYEFIWLEIANSLSKNRQRLRLLILLYIKGYILSDKYVSGLELGFPLHLHTNKGGGAPCDVEGCLLWDFLRLWVCPPGVVDAPSKDSAPEFPERPTISRPKANSWVCRPRLMASKDAFRLQKLS